MRFLLKASFPVEAAKKAAKEGRLAKIIESMSPSGNGRKSLAFRRRLQ